MRVIAIICVFFLSFSAMTQTDVMSVEAETRARDIGRSLRCVVCQNQSIEESDASLAKDMRLLVRERVALGKSDAEIIEFMRLRYGDYVLLKPPLQKNTVLLWFLPVLIILSMGIWLITFTRTKQIHIAQPDAFTDEEQNILNRLMDGTP